MNPVEQRELKRVLVTMSMYFGKPLDDGVLLMYVADLADLPFNEVMRALVAYRRNPKNRQMLLPADIRAAVKPQMNEEDACNAAVSKLIESISKYGYTNPDRARAYMGELAWEVVKREGGWERVCELVTNENKLIFRAQILKVAKSVVAGETQLPATIKNDRQISNQATASPILVGALFDEITGKQEKENVIDRRQLASDQGEK